MRSKKSLICGVNYMTLKIRGKVPNDITLKVDERDDELEPTWFEFNRYDDGRPSLTGYAGDKPIVQTDTKSVESLITMLKRYQRTAKTFLVADTRKIIPEIGDIDEPTPPPRPPMQEGGQKLEWIPFAERYGNIPTKGYYPNKHPQGAIIHHTAGRRDNPKGTVDYLAQQPFPCLVIGHDGVILQPFPISKWGWHDGTSYSKKCIGIEVCSAGRLSRKNGKWVSWFGSVIPDHRVRVIHSQNGNQQPGGYEMWTDAQIDSAINVCAWMKHNDLEGFEFDMILGHDETAPHRKNDPGGSMPFTMSEFRKLCKERYQENYG